jgi:hypothetical protein
VEGALALNDVQKSLKFWMEWFVAHQPQIYYGMERPFPIGSRLPMTCDCSATYTNLWYLGGGRDPNGPSCPAVGHHDPFDGYGSTYSLALHGQLCAARQLAVGDAVIYYNGYGWSPSDTVHVAMVYELNGEDPLTMSHGWSGEPALVHVSEDGRPHQFFKYPLNPRVAPKPPTPKQPVARGNPTADQLAKAHLVGLKNTRREAIARSHGWTIYYFSEGHEPSPWVPLIDEKPIHVPLYANAAWDSMR